jgi:cephalosporin-C deacetylase
MKIQHDLPFDPEYGYTLEQLFSVPAPKAPNDYVDFWTKHYREAMDIPLNLAHREVNSPDSAFRLFEVEYDSYQGVRVGAWITVPVGADRLQAGMVVGHGYGGREAPDFSTLVVDAVCIFPCARGFHRSACDAFPNNAEAHVLSGIESRETYSHLGSVIDYWLAASVLLELYPQVRDRLYYSGGSFGGGMGALLLPWDARFTKAFLNIPSFGNHPLRVTLDCVGSGAAVKNYYEHGHPEILDVLSYFDAATAAERITIPVFVAAAVFDPAVPPPGQFAIYNALSGPKQFFIRQAAHFELAGNEFDDQAVNARLMRWFAD